MQECHCNLVYFYFSKLLYALRKESKHKKIQQCLTRKIQNLRGESHINIRTQFVIMTLEGDGVIANDILKMRKVIKFQSS